MVQCIRVVSDTVTAGGYANQNKPAMLKEALGHWPTDLNPVGILVAAENSKASSGIKS